MKKKLKINRLLKYWNNLNILRTNGILIFCQNLSLNAFKDWQMSSYLNDLDYKWKVLNKNVIKNVVNKKFIIKIKKFNYILIIKDINYLKEIEIFLKKNDILILGYYLQHFFFFKKDFEIKKKEKKNIVDNLKKRVIKLYKSKINILLNFKYLISKIILLLKKKNGNN